MYVEILQSTRVFTLITASYWVFEHNRGRLVLACSVNASFAHVNRMILTCGYLDSDLPAEHVQIPTSQGS